jgi:tetratricopeptide (TPR) repeat protein
MPRMKWILGLLVLVWLVASSSADTLTDQAKRDVTAGLAAQSEGRYDDAIALYKRAYDAVPHPEILFDLAQAYRLKGDAETALGLYQRYVAVEPRGRVAADARRWVAELEKIVAQHNADPARKAEQARKADEARKAEEARRAEAHKTELAKAEAARRSEVRRTDAARPDTARAPDATRKPATSRSEGAFTSVAAARTPGPPDQPRDDGAWSIRRRYAVIAAGAGGAFLIGGGVLGVLARSKRNAAYDVCGHDGVCDTAEDASQANALLKASRTRGNGSTVLFALGGAGVVTGAVLWLTGRDATHTAFAPVIAPSSVGMAWEGRF